MRTVSATIETGIAAAITEPIYFIEVSLTTPLYWTTGAAITWDSKSWVPVGLHVDRVGEGGAQLSIRNDNDIGAGLVLNNVLRDTEFRIYQNYGTDAVEIFRGYGGAAVIEAMYAVITLHPNKASRTKAPRGRIASPVFTHLPKPGEIIAWGDDRLQVTN